MESDAPAYGLWSLVIINAAFFILFAFSSTKPKTSRGNASEAPREALAAHGLIWNKARLPGNLLAVRSPGAVK